MRSSLYTHAASPCARAAYDVNAPRTNNQLLPLAACAVPCTNEPMSYEQMLDVHAPESMRHECNNELHAPSCYVHPAAHVCVSQ
eukprot:3833213-Pyramimonas_sp.AAC.1